MYGALNIINEFSRECLAIRVERTLNSADVIDALTNPFIMRGVSACIRSDNGPEFIAEAVTPSTQSPLISSLRRPREMEEKRMMHFHSNQNNR